MLGAFLYLQIFRRARVVALQTCATFLAVGVLYGFRPSQCELSFSCLEGLVWCGAPNVSSVSRVWRVWCGVALQMRVKFLAFGARLSKCFADDL